MWGRYSMLGLATVALFGCGRKLDDGEACRTSSECAGGHCVYGLVGPGAACSESCEDSPCPAGWKCGMVHELGSPKHVDLVCKPIPAPRPVSPTTQIMTPVDEDDPLDLEKLRNGRAGKYLREIPDAAP